MVFNQGGHFFLLSVVSHHGWSSSLQGGLSAVGLLPGWSFIMMFCPHGGLIIVIFHQGGLSSEWCYPQGGLSSQWSFIKVVSDYRVVFPKGGLLSQWSFVRLVFCMVVFHPGCLL